MKEKYAIHCPKCKSTFDVSEQMNVWKNEIIDKFEKLLKEEKGE